MSYDASVNNPTPNVFEVEVIANNDLVTAVEEARQYAEDAENSADSASASASSASASASNANNFANSASNSASSASSSASTATTQAGIATTQAGIATTKANEASQSESNALDSEQASAQSASDALQSEQNAFASEQASAQSEANALASASSASASASTATTQAGIATTQAGIATTQAGIATTQASNALNSANAAAASAASAAAVGTSTVLTGFSVAGNTAIAGTDTILQAFNKTQGQINARVSGTGVSGQVSFWTGTGTQSGDNGLWFDTVNKRFGIGTNTPEAIFHTRESGSGNMYVAIHKSDNTNGNSINLDFITSPSYVPTLTNFGGRLRYTRLGSFGVGDWDIMSANSTGAPVSRLKIFSNGNVLIQNGGTFIDAGFLLDISGTARVSGRTNIVTGSDTNTAVLINLQNPFSGNNTGVTLRFNNSATVDAAQGQAEITALRTNTGLSGATDLIFRTSVGASVTEKWRITATGVLTAADGCNIAFNTTTGTKIGTSAAQKLALWNATPIVQPTTSVAAATRVGGGGTNITDTDTFDGYTLAQIVKGLRNMGAFA
jgi:hypothetical protein